MRALVIAPYGTNLEALVSVLADLSVTAESTTEVATGTQLGAAPLGRFSFAVAVVSDQDRQAGLSAVGIEIGVAVGRGLPVVVVVEPPSLPPPVLATLPIISSRVNNEAALRFNLQLFVATLSKGQISDSRNRYDHSDPVSDVAWSPDGSLLGTACLDAAAHIFDSRTGEETSRYAHGDWVRAVKWSPNGLLLASASDDGTARVFDVQSGHELHRHEHGGIVRDIAWSPDGSMIVSASDDGTARVFDVQSGQELHCHYHGGIVRDVTWSPDGSLIASASEDRSVRVFDPSAHQEVCRLEHGGGVRVVAWSPDGSLVATGSADGLARVFDPQRGDEICRHDDGAVVRDVAWSPDGSSVASASDDSAARVFDARTGVVIRRHEHGGWVRGVRWSPDGAFLATASDDRTARVFDARTGVEIHRHEHGGRVRTVAWSPDGALLATASDDRTARVFSLGSHLQYQGPPDTSLTREDLFDLRGELARTRELEGPGRAIAFERLIASILRRSGAIVEELAIRGSEGVDSVALLPGAERRLGLLLVQSRVRPKSLLDLAEAELKLQNYVIERQGGLGLFIYDGPSMQSDPYSPLVLSMQIDELLDKLDTWPLARFLVSARNNAVHRI